MKKVIMIFLTVASVSVFLLAGCVTVKNNGETSSPSSAKSTATPAVTTTAANTKTAAASPSAPITSSAAPAVSAYVDFNTKTLSGDSVDQSIFQQHKITFINFWATWCGPCVGELPDLQKLYEKYKGDIGFIGICGDATDSESAAHAKKIIDKSGDTYTNLMNFDQVTDIMGDMQFIPCSIIVDSTGKPLSGQLVGSEGNDKYSAAIDAALAKVK